MALRHFLFLVFSLHLYAQKSTYGVYPLFTDAQNRLYVMQQCVQEGVISTHVSCFNQETSSYELVTSGFCMPIGVTPLVDKSGFSFIDNGLIKIQLFTARSAARIEPDFPIFEPTKIICFLHDSFIVAAQLADNRGIFLVTRQGDTTPILYKQGFEYDQPCLIGNSLFCVEYNCLSKQWYLVVVKDFCSATASVVTFLSSSHVICLTMLTEDEGFFLNYTHNNDHIDFACMHIVRFKSADHWQEECLFSFSIPSFFLVGMNTMRLAESVCAVAPRYIANGVLYVDYMQDMLRPYFYCFTCRSSHAITFKTESPWIAYVTPYVDIVHNCILIGGLHNQQCDVPLERIDIQSLCGVATK